MPTCRTIDGKRCVGQRNSQGWNGPGGGFGCEERDRLALELYLPAERSAGGHTWTTQTGRKL